MRLLPSLQLLRISFRCFPTLVETRWHSSKPHCCGSSRSLLCICAPVVMGSPKCVRRSWRSSTTIAAGCWFHRGWLGVPFRFWRSQNTMKPRLTSVSLSISTLTTRFCGSGLRSKVCLDDDILICMQANISAKHATPSGHSILNARSVSPRTCATAGQVNIWSFLSSNNAWVTVACMILQCRSAPVLLTHNGHFSLTIFMVHRITIRHLNSSMGLHNTRVVSVRSDIGFWCCVLPLF